MSARAEMAWRIAVGFAVVGAIAIAAAVAVLA